MTGLIGIRTGIKRTICEDTRLSEGIIRTMTRVRTRTGRNMAQFKVCVLIGYNKHRRHGADSPTGSADSTIPSPIPQKRKLQPPIVAPGDYQSVSPDNLALRLTGLSPRASQSHFDTPSSTPPPTLPRSQAHPQIGFRDMLREPSVSSMLSLASELDPLNLTGTDPANGFGSFLDDHDAAMMESVRMERELERICFGDRDALISQAVEETLSPPESEETPSLSSADDRQDLRSLPALDKGDIDGLDIRPLKAAIGGLYQMWLAARKSRGVPGADKEATRMLFLKIADEACRDY